MMFWLLLCYPKLPICNPPSIFLHFRVHCAYLKRKPRRGENEIRANKKLMGTMFLRNMLLGNSNPPRRHFRALRSFSVSPNILTRMKTTNSISKLFLIYWMGCEKKSVKIHLWSNSTKSKLYNESRNFHFLLLVLHIIRFFRPIFWMILGWHKGMMDGGMGMLSE